MVTWVRVHGHRVFVFHYTCFSCEVLEFYAVGFTVGAYMVEGWSLVVGLRACNYLFSASLHLCQSLALTLVRSQVAQKGGKWEKWESWFFGNTNKIGE